jgi:hypothetical protein
VELGVAAEAGRQRGLQQGHAALGQHRVDAIEAQAIPVFDQRQAHLGLEDAGEPADADLEPARDRARVDGGVLGQQGDRGGDQAASLRLDGVTPARARHGADRVQDRAQHRTEDRGVGLLDLVDRPARQPGVVEQHADRDVR